MTFANPYALYALSLLAIPIAIHLLNLRRAKKVYFSNVKLLSQIQTSTNAINHIKSLLILLCRLLFIAFLVLAFARPSSRNPSTGEAEREAAFLLDNSLSMQNRQSGKPLLNISVATLQKIADSYPVSTRFYFAQSGVWQQNDFYRLQENFTNVDYANTTPLLAQQLTKLKKKASYTPSSVYIVSDFQKANVGKLDDLVFDTAVQYFLIPVLPESRENLAVDSVWLQTPYLQTNIPNSVWVRVKNYGTNTAENIPVSLFVNQIQSGTASIKIEPNSHTDVELPLLVKNSGVFQGNIQIQDPIMLFDNTFYFTVSVAQVVSVSHISQSPSKYVGSVFSDSTFFDYAFFNPNQLNVPRLALSDLLIVENIDQPSLALIEELIRALDRGASVAVIPSERNTPEHWQALATYSLTTAATPLPIAVPDEQEPFFSDVFEELPSVALMPTAKPTLVPKNGRPILRLKDNTPYVSLASVSKGKLYLFASPLDAKHTDLSQNGLFVPLMFKMAFSSVSANEKIAYRLDGQYANLPIKGLQRNDLFSIGKGGFIPEQKISPYSLLIAIPALEVSAGTYPLVRTRDDSLMSQLSFNFPQQESQTDYYSPEELSASLGGIPNVKIVSGTSLSNVVSTIDQAKKGYPLWKWFLFIALVALALETLLVRFSKARYKKNVAA